MQYVQISLAKQLQELDTKPSMLLMYAIAVALFDFILMGLQTFHEFLYALIARQIDFNFKKLMWCSFIILSHIYPVGLILLVAPQPDTLISVLIIKSTSGSICQL